MCEARAKHWEAFLRGPREKRRRLQDCQKAVELLQAAHADNPDDVDGIGLELAQALNAVMRIRTHSNTLHITEMLDTPEHRFGAKVSFLRYIITSLL